MKLDLDNIYHILQLQDGGRIEEVSEIMFDDKVEIMSPFQQEPELLKRQVQMRAAAELNNHHLSQLDTQMSMFGMGASSNPLHL